MPGREPDAEAGAAGLMEPVWKEYEQTGNAAGALRRLFVWSEELEAEAAGGDAGRPGTAAGAQAEGKPAVRGDQRQGRSAADLPTDLLSARRSGEPHQGTQGGVEMDRASCTSFYANQFRVLLSAAAYALLQELRWRARETRFARTQAEGLRLCQLKLGVWVRSSDAAGRTEPAQGGAIRVGVAADCQESGSGADLGEPGADRQRREGNREAGVSLMGEGHRVAGASQPRFRRDHSTGCRPSRPVRCRDGRRDRKTGPKTVRTLQSVEITPQSAIGAPFMNSSG